jgi:hypothetical protein
MVVPVAKLSDRLEQTGGVVLEWAWARHPWCSGVPDN